MKRNLIRLSGGLLLIAILGIALLLIISPRVTVSDSLAEDSFNGIDGGTCSNRSGVELPFDGYTVNIEDSHFYMIVDNFGTWGTLRGELGASIAENGKLGIALLNAHVAERALATFLVRQLEGMVIPPLSQLVADCIVQLGISDYTLREIEVRNTELYFRFEAKLIDVIRTFAPDYLPFLD